MPGSCCSGSWACAGWVSIPSSSTGSSAPASEAAKQVAWALSVLRPFGLEDSCSIDVGGGTSWAFGVPSWSPSRDSPFLVDVMGFTSDDDVLAAARRRVFLDIDPGFPQLWTDLGLADPFAGYDRFVTVGTGINNTCVDGPPVRPDVADDTAPCRPGAPPARPAAGAGAAHDRRNLARPLRADRAPGPDLRPSGPRVPALHRPSCEDGPPVRDRARHRSIGDRRPRAPGRSRVAPRRPPGGGRRRRAVPVVPRPQLGGDTGGQAPLRGHAGWLVQ